jgi:hypothetical protein
LRNIVHTSIIRVLWGLLSLLKIGMMDAIKWKSHVYNFIKPLEGLWVKWKITIIVALLWLNMA